METDLHLCLRRSRTGDGGGHLGAGSIVRTTAEIGIAKLPGVVFRRAFDPATGYRELIVRKTGRRR